MKIYYNVTHTQANKIKTATKLTRKSKEIIIYFFKCIHKTHIKTPTKTTTLNNKNKQTKKQKTRKNPTTKNTQQNKTKTKTNNQTKKQTTNKKQTPYSFITPYQWSFNLLHSFITLSAPPGGPIELFSFRCSTEGIKKRGMHHSVSVCYLPRSDYLYSLVPTIAGGPPSIASPPFLFLSRTEEQAKAGTCARDRRALQQLALNVHVKHSDLT